MTQPSTEHLVEAGGAALRAGQREQARRLLSQAVRADPRNPQAWLYLAGAVTDLEQRRSCLQRVIALSPGHETARRALATLPPADPTSAPTARPKAASPKPDPRKDASPRRLPLLPGSEEPAATAGRLPLLPGSEEPAATAGRLPLLPGSGEPAATAGRLPTPPGSADAAPVRLPAQGGLWQRLATPPPDSASPVAPAPVPPEPGPALAGQDNAARTPLPASPAFITARHRKPGSHNALPKTGHRLHPDRHLWWAILVVGVLLMLGSLVYAGLAL